MNLPRGQKRMGKEIVAFRLFCHESRKQKRTLEGFDTLLEPLVWIYLDAECGKDDAIYKPTPKIPIKRKIKPPVVYKSLISHLQGQIQCRHRPPKNWAPKKGSQVQVIKYPENH